MDQTDVVSEFKVGDAVSVSRCDECNAVIGKRAVVKEITSRGLKLNFGRGRPQKWRPEYFEISSVQTWVELENAGEN